MEPRALRILVVSGDPTALRATAQALVAHRVVRAESPEQARAELQRGQFDVVVSDVDLPEVDGGAYRILFTGTAGIADLVLERGALRQLAWVCATIGGSR